MELIHVRNSSCYWNFSGGTVKYDVSGKMEIQEKAENNTVTHKWANMGGSLWLYTYCRIFQNS